MNTLYYLNHYRCSGREDIMALISLKNNKKESPNPTVKDRVKEDPNGRGLVMRTNGSKEPFTNRTGLINGLTIAEQDPNVKKRKASKKSKGNNKVGASAALLKK